MICVGLSPRYASTAATINALRFSVFASIRSTNSSLIRTGIIFDMYYTSAYVLHLFSRPANMYYGYI